MRRFATFAKAQTFSRMRMPRTDPLQAARGAESTLALRGMSLELDVLLP
ncbi:MAG: hypothetical protein ACOVKS_11125 [Aquimonas sp.]